MTKDSTQVVISPEKAVEFAIQKLGPTAWYSDLHADRFRITLDILQRYISPGGSILELGVWPGFLALALVKSGYAVRGVDLEPARLPEIITQQIEIQQQDLNRLTKPLAVENSLDGIIAAEVIEHVQPTAISSIQQSLYHSLKPNGILIVTTPNGRRIGRRVKKQPLTGADTHGHGHEHEYDLAELRGLWPKQDWRILMNQPVNFYAQVGKISDQAYYRPLWNFWRHSHPIHNAAKLATIMFSTVVPAWRDSLVLVAQKIGRA